MSVKKVYGFGIVLSILFSFMYFLFFQSFVNGDQQDKTSLVLSYIQVGIYEEETQVQTTMNLLKDISLHKVKVNDLYYLISDFFENEKDAKQLSDQFVQRGYSVMIKKKEISDSSLIARYYDQDYDFLIEALFY